MSDNHTKPIPMEVEESGMEDYIANFERMLDEVDSPNEVNGAGKGPVEGTVRLRGSLIPCAGMGGSKVAKPKPHP